MTTPTVMVTMPNGTNTIPNPLYAYRFHPVYQEDFYYNPVSRQCTFKAHPIADLPIVVLLELNDACS